MKKLCSIVLMCAFASVPAMAQDAPAANPSAATAPAVVATKGQMLHASDGGRLARVNRVLDDGSVQIIIDGRIVTVPAATLSMVDGELTTSLSKVEVLALH